MEENKQFNRQVRQLSDPSATTRRQAVAALSDLGGPEATGALVGCLTDSDPQVRYRAVDALAKLGAGSAVPRIRNSLDDPVSMVRRSAVTALVRLGDTSARPLVRNLLTDQEPAVRAAAIEALMKFGDTSALPELVVLRRDRAPTVRRAAEEAIFTLENQQPTSAIPTDDSPDEPALPEPPPSRDDTPALQLLISALRGLRVNEYDAVNLRVSNSGQGPALGLNISVEGAPWQSEAHAMGDLPAGASRSDTLYLLPKNSGPQVRITFRLTYDTAAGASAELVYNDALPVSAIDDNRASQPPITINVQQQMTGEGVNVGRQVAGQPSSSTGPAASSGTCPHCGKSLALTESGEDRAQASSGTVAINLQQQATEEGVNLGRQYNVQPGHPSQPATPAPSSVYCTECGKLLELPEPPQFCPHCGKPQASD